ncbi:MAG: homoserine dehydrogenase [Planctomycetota bacterium]
MPRSGVIVLKLGGSVLLDEQRLRPAVHEVYRWRRAGYAVVAVVSALSGTTDELLARCARLGPDASGWSVAAAVSTGELQSAALLGLTLEQAGLRASVLTPSALRLVAVGEPLDATPVALDARRLERALAHDGVVVVPGFVGEDRRGRAALLGRGGSDLTALFLASALGARCRLVKDVDGLYERDPALPGPPPRRYAHASWRDALATDGSILQHKALRFAESRGLELEVATLDGADATAVGAGPSALAPAAGRRPLRIALLGLGVVGGGLWELARELPERFEVAAVAARDAARARRLGVPDELLWSDPVAAAGSGVDVVVELLGGRETARAAIAAGLASCADVVTANKHVLAEDGAELRSLARIAGRRLLASAAVGGNAPLLERIAATPPGEIVAVRGVLNGTTNYVLERCSDGLRLEQALSEARARGLAESDATRDLDGRDAGDKLVVLAHALGAGELATAQVEREPIDEAAASWARAARERGRVLRHVATLHLPTLAEPGAPCASVRLEELPANDPLAEIAGPENAALLCRPGAAPEVVRGTGAGRWPTAEAVLGDLGELARAPRYSSESRSREAELMQ